MDKLKFKKDDVLKTLVKNRTEHLQIVKENQKGYREKFEKMLLQRLSDLREGKKVNTHFDLRFPSSHVDDYDRAIEMLQMCVDTEVTLSQQEFQCYMRDKWSWQADYLVASSAYSDTANMKYNSTYGSVEEE
jgi:hypothetical protein